LMRPSTENNGAETTKEKYGGDVNKLRRGKRRAAERGIKRRRRRKPSERQQTRCPFINWRHSTKYGRKRKGEEKKNLNAEGRGDKTQSQKPSVVVARPIK